MLRLTKSVSDENYPISPQTSAVRKLKVRAQPQSVCDLSNSYLIVKNSIQTKLGNTNVVRNVGWGASMSDENQWEYPASAQIRTAALYVGGQLVEYNEDLNVRRVNMDVYGKSAERIRKEANMGSYGFQRLPGPKIATADATTANMHSGNYLSPFISQNFSNQLDNAGLPIPNVYQFGQASYQQVASVIYLSDIFEFCRVATDANLAGKEVVVELQFEDRNTMLTEFVNYKTKLGQNIPATVADTTPFDHQLLLLDNTSLQTKVGGAGAAVPFVPGTYVLADEILIKLVNKFNSPREVPLFVGQPICIWQDGTAVAVVSSNIFVITSLVLNADKTLTVGFKAYQVQGAALNSALATAVTAAEVAANIAGANPVLKYMSLINDPFVSGTEQTIFVKATVPAAAGGARTKITSLDAGQNSTYSVDGLELVMMEMPGVAGKKQTFEYFQYMRDVDVIPTGQLTYQKTFQLDPGCVAVYALFPCAKDVGAANTNMLSVSHRSNVSEGLSWRNLLNGEALYNRDIVFSSVTDAVEPLYVHRLGLAAKQIRLTMENLVQNQIWMSHDGVACHAMVAEPVQFSQQPQQLAVRLNFDVNANSRTIYVYKAVLREFTI